ncbi:hypothetical protein Sme01_69120 [Sphaerisporangium melleum]|uniref:Uncharacterized protein n=1 Tax=Sphaerisporangium melleum TaxID=321316 RepID=A0A917VRX9_9ACTN|nr:hypothetical protein GCM10007964_63410 [Sphaerisporangium melleum]GII74436.1 hypothetical protein Sme01_69120 [Sphaerisporangium melleum]
MTRTVTRHRSTPTGIGGHGRAGARAARRRAGRAQPGDRGPQIGRLWSDGAHSVMPKGTRTVPSARPAL